MWVRKEIRWHGGGIVAHVLTVSLAISQALVFCSASGTPLGSGDGEALRGDQQHRQQETRQRQHPDARETPFDVAGPSTANDNPDPASAAPEQVHISFASSGSLEEYAVTVAWSTWPEARSQVNWGSSPRKQDNVAYGSSTCEWAHQYEYSNEQCVTGTAVTLCERSTFRRVASSYCCTCLLLLLHLCQVA